MILGRLRHPAHPPSPQPPADQLAVIPNVLLWDSSAGVHAKRKQALLFSTYRKHESGRVSAKLIRCHQTKINFSASVPPSFFGARSSFLTRLQREIRIEDEIHITHTHLTTIIYSTLALVWAQAPGEEKMEIVFC